MEPRALRSRSPAGEIRLLIPNQPPTRLASILPSAFGPAALGASRAALPVEKKNLVLAGGASDPCIGAALDAASRSYAPYSKSPAGVAIRTSSGRIFQGCYIENVAFNPSLSPLQTALVPLIAAGEPYSSISAITLVEIEGSKISQRSVTETVLAALVPQLKLTVVSAHIGS